MAAARKRLCGGGDGAADYTDRPINIQSLRYIWWTYGGASGGIRGVYEGLVRAVYLRKSPPPSHSIRLFYIMKYQQSFGPNRPRLKTPPPLPFMIYPPFGPLSLVVLSYIYIYIYTGKYNNFARLTCSRTIGVFHACIYNMIQWIYTLIRIYVKPGNNLLPSAINKTRRRSTHRTMQILLIGINDARAHRLGGCLILLYSYTIILQLQWWQWWQWWGEMTERENERETIRVGKLFVAVSSPRIYAIWRWEQIKKLQTFHQPPLSSIIEYTFL